MQLSSLLLTISSVVGLASAGHARIPSDYVVNATAVPMFPILDCPWNRPNPVCCQSKLLYLDDPHTISLQLCKRIVNLDSLPCETPKYKHACCKYGSHPVLNGGASDCKSMPGKIPTFGWERVDGESSMDTD